jgi:hypothetical protein
MASYDRAEGDVRAIVSDRAGVSDATGLYPRLAAAAAIAAVKTVLGTWARAEPPPQLITDLSAAAFDHIATGFTRPPR